MPIQPKPWPKPLPPLADLDARHKMSGAIWELDPFPLGHGVNPKRSPLSVIYLAMIER